MPYDQNEIDETREVELRALADEFGLEFDRLGVLNQALTHRSYAFENPPAEDNERLEFLGDSVLGFVASEYLYRRYPEASEGDLSKRKARVVSRALLGELAIEIGLGKYVRLGHGEERTGGRKRVSLLGSALEALIGAVYLSQGFDAAALLIRERFLDRLLVMLEQEESWDYKSRLQEYAQKHHQAVPRYEVTDATGPDHDKTFTVRVALAGRIFPGQSAPRKKAAENLAAKAALETIEQENGLTGGDD